MGPGGPYDGGTAGIQSTTRTASVPMKSFGERDEGVDDFY
jgi:hypothetical protein